MLTQQYFGINSDDDGTYIKIKKSDLAVTGMNPTTATPAQIAGALIQFWCGVVDELNGINHTGILMQYQDNPAVGVVPTPMTTQGSIGVDSRGSTYQIRRTYSLSLYYPLNSPPDPDNIV